MKKQLLIAAPGSSSFLFAQTVCIGTQQQCAEAQQRLCAAERAPANFELSSEKLIVGTVSDETGARFDSGIAVQLRDPKLSKVLLSAEVRDGAFSLGTVPSGSYRVIVVKQGKQGPERLGTFDQPKSLVCNSRGNECVLDVVPKVHGTDNPIDFCPPR